MRSILVVDDQEDLLEMAVLILMKMGISETEIVTARNGVQVRQYLEHGWTFDVVVTDYDMPGRNGLDVLLDIRLFLGEHTRAVLVSSTLTDNVTAVATSLGAACIEKPLTANKVLKALGRHPLE